MKTHDFNYKHIGDLSSSVPSQLPTLLRVHEVNDHAAFMALELEWNALAEAMDSQVFYRHEFIRTWVDTFATGAHLRILSARDDTGDLAAVLPLTEERSTMYGAPVRQLVAAANLHSYRFDLIARDAEAAGRAFFDYLSADTGWDLIRAIGVPLGGATWHLYDAARDAGLPVGAWASLQSPYITLPTTFVEFQARLHPKFRANLRRRRKKLEARGEVIVERASEEAQLDQELREGF